MTISQFGLLMDNIGEIEKLFSGDDSKSDSPGLGGVAGSNMARRMFGKG